jgi:hypothetical protein
MLCVQECRYLDIYPSCFLPLQHVNLVLHERTACLAVASHPIQPLYQLRLGTYHAMLISPE